MSLAELSPDAGGIPLKKWLRQQITEQCDAYCRSLDPNDAPLSKQQIQGKRKYEQKEG